MTAVAVDHLASRLRRLAGLSWMTGPILDKELRVSSRRRRSYILRFAYIVVLTGLVALSWGDLGGFAAGQVSAAKIISRMADAGREMTGAVLWFQFIVMQVLAMALLSTSFREEMQRRTLGVLMTTPITGWQFVMGKLLSKLLPLLTLLALSLPLLAIVRVFGGVPWGYIVSSLCITFTAMILMGSITLFFAAADRSAIGVIVLTVLTWVAVFAIPFRVAGAVGSGSLLTLVFVANPLVAMAANSMMWLSPGWGAPLFFGSFLWVIHCGIALGISALIVRAAARRVRSVGLLALQEGGATRRRRKKRPPSWAPLSPTTGSAQAPGVQGGEVRPSARVVGLRGAREAVRRVHGSPLIWKELRFYIPGSTPKTGHIAGAVKYNAGNALAFQFGIKITQFLARFLIEIVRML